MTLSWEQLHEILDISEVPPGGPSFSGVASLERAGPSEISFLGNARYLPDLKTTRAGVILLPEGDFSVAPEARQIVVANPSEAFTRLIDYFQKEQISFRAGVSAGAHVADGVELNRERVSVGPGVTIERGAIVGNGSTLCSGAFVGEGVVIGEDCYIHPNVTVRAGCLLGDRVILQPGAVIGSDGYGYELIEGRHEKVPQVGIVEVEDDVEIGANTCIDRARFGRTVIGKGTKIDNLVQIAHNVEIGEHCLLVSQCGMAGSSRLGNYVTIAAQAGVGGHLKLGDQVVVTAQSGVLKNLPDAGAYLGTPARPMKQEQRKMASLNRVPELLKEVKILKKKLEELANE